GELVSRVARIERKLLEHPVAGQVRWAGRRLAGSQQPHLPQQPTACPDHGRCVYSLVRDRRAVVEFDPVDAPWSNAIPIYRRAPEEISRQTDMKGTGVLTALVCDDDGHGLVIVARHRSEIERGGRENDAPGLRVRLVELQLDASLRESRLVGDHDLAGGVRGRSGGVQLDVEPARAEGRDGGKARVGGEGA